MLSELSVLPFELSWCLVCGVVASASLSSSLESTTESVQYIPTMR